MAFFQLPWLPETLLSLAGYALPRRALLSSCRPGAFTAEDLAVYRRAWSRPGALRSMIHWYRAVARARPRPRTSRVVVPTCIIWGAQDRFLGREMAPASLAMCDDGRLEMIEEATHWVHHEEPGRVVTILEDALGEPAGD